MCLRCDFASLRGVILSDNGMILSGQHCHQQYCDCHLFSLLVSKTSSHDLLVAPSGRAKGGCGEQRLHDIARTTVPIEVGRPLRPRPSREPSACNIRASTRPCFASLPSAPFRYRPSPRPSRALARACQTGESARSSQRRSECISACKVSLLRSQSSSAWASAIRTSSAPPWHRCDPGGQNCSGPRSNPQCARQGKAWSPMPSPAAQ